MIYEECGDYRVQHFTSSSFFFIFLLTVRRIWMSFSLKPSPYQGQLSLKIPGRWDSPFRWSQGTSKHTHKITHSLTDRLALLQNDRVEICLQRSHCILGSFKSVVFMSQEWSQKGLNWVSRAVLSANYDDVSLFSKKGYKNV